MRENVAESIGERIIIEEMDGWTDEEIKQFIGKECRQCEWTKGGMIHK